MDPNTLDVLEYPALKELLLAHAGSELSRQVIRELKPSTDPERLALSLGQVDEARALLDRGRPIPIRGLRDVRALVGAAHRQQRALEPDEFRSVRRMLVAVQRLREFFSPLREETPHLGSLAERLLDHRAISDAIERLIDERSGVRDDASPRLWELRRRRTQLEDEIRDVMNGLANSKRLRPFLQDRTWTVRGDRMVLMVKLDKKGHVPGILHDKSASGETAFVEPSEVVMLANELAEVKLDEQREVTHLLLELSRLLFQEEARLGYSQDVAAWLDFCAARAAFSADLGLVPARLSKSPNISLRVARHPLLLASHRRGELEHEVVPVSVALGERYRMMVITGPNTGGKTVTLKTVGLIQLMFQSGLHVPCAPGCELPCLAGIHADIGDEQSLSQNLSTFSGHVRNIARILEDAAEDRLILLDELGAGTDPAEGAALGQAVLEFLREKGALTMVSTHLGDLKAFAFSRADVENASVAFDPETLSPTFELLVGQPGNSNALIIAERHGLPASIIASARDLASGERSAADDLMDELMESRVAAERSRRATADLEAETQARLDNAESALAEAREAKQRVEREAEAEVDRIFDAFVEEVRPDLNALKNVPKALRSHVDRLEELMGRRLRAEPLAELRRDFLGKLKKHDQVYVPRFGQVCRIEKLNRAEERLVVRVGAVSMEIPYDDVSWVTPPRAV